MLQNLLSWMGPISGLGQVQAPAKCYVRQYNALIALVFQSVCMGQIWSLS